MGKRTKIAIAVGFAALLVYSAAVAFLDVNVWLRHIGSLIVGSGAGFLTEYCLRKDIAARMLAALQLRLRAGILLRSGNKSVKVKQ